MLNFRRSLGVVREFDQHTNVGIIARERGQAGVRAIAATVTIVVRKTQIARTITSSERDHANPLELVVKRFHKVAIVPSQLHVSWRGSITEHSGIESQTRGHFWRGLDPMYASLPLK